MTVKTYLANDPREILSISKEDGRWSISIWDTGVSRIECYIEDGGTPWFATYDKDGQIIQRINSRHIEEVTYS